MGSAESHPSGSEPMVRYDASVAAIVNDGSASKPSASLGARHTVDKLSNLAVVADGSRQATDLIVAPVAAAVCPGIVTRQSCQLLDDSTGQNAVPVRIEKAGLRYNGAVNVEQEAGKKNVDCQMDLDETLTLATYRTAMESEDSGDGRDQLDAGTVTTVKKKPSTPHPDKDRRININRSTLSGKSKKCTDPDEAYPSAA